MSRKATTQTLPMLAKSNRPPPPADLPPEAAALWVSICASLEPDYFAGADLTLLEALVRADYEKRRCDALVQREGPIVDGKAHAAAKLSNQYAASMAALAGKLRLCQSSRTRPESAGLRKAVAGGPRPWESPEAQEFFQ